MQARESIFAYGYDMLLKYRQFVSYVANGAVSNTIATVGVMPLNYMWISKQDKRTQTSYGESFRYICTRRGLLNVYLTFFDILKLAPKQSLFYLGFSNALLQYYKDDSIVERSAKAGSASAVLESIGTVRNQHQIAAKLQKAGILDAVAELEKAGEAQKAFELLQFKNPPLELFTQRYYRCLMMTFGRNVIANPLTFINVLYIRAYLESRLRPDTELKKAGISSIAGFFGSTLTALIVAPLVYLQTNVLRYPDERFASQIVELTPAKAYRGTAMRVATKGIDGLIKFGVMSVLNSASSRYLQSEPVKIAADTPAIGKSRKL